MTSPPEFIVDVYQNEYLPMGAREVSAVVTVTAADISSMSTEHVVAAAAEIIIVDCSGSMSAPNTKLTQAQQATAAAIDVIRDGTAFAVIAGSTLAHSLYPADGTMAIADTRSRLAAKRAVGRLTASGGTAIGQWLRAAHRTFLTRRDDLRHAILLTDGQNRDETTKQLADAIKLCTDVFRCDCRGVGTDWQVAELRQIAAALMGTVDIVPDPVGLTADFEALMAVAMAKQVADMRLRVWTPKDAGIRFVKQVAPTIEDLTGRRVHMNEQLGTYPTGAWAAGESRDYHVCVRVQPATREMLAARVSLVHQTESGEQNLGQGLVRAIWTEDVQMSTRINTHVAHFEGQEDLKQAIADGLAARKAGDQVKAEDKLGKAVALAQASGHEESLRLLARIVDIVDVEKGTVRLKPKVMDADEMALDTRSTKTVRVKK
jgi:von Willebrand factor type A C-terminal domain/von Willebrand factor type A domain